MTPVVLLEALKAFIEHHTKDIVLAVRPVKRKEVSDCVTARAVEVHLMRLPDKEAETNRVPYVLLQLLSGKDHQAGGSFPESECFVRVIVVTYSKDGGAGATDLLNVLTRIRTALLRAGEVGEQFLLKKPLEYIVYPDETNPYYFGELMTIWELPTIEREVHTHYVDE